MEVNRESKSNDIEKKLLYKVIQKEEFNIK